MTAYGLKCNQWYLTLLICSIDLLLIHAESYEHIATRELRRIDIIWSGNEVDKYEILKKEAEKVEQDLPEFVKKTLEKHFNMKND